MKGAFCSTSANSEGINDCRADRYMWSLCSSKPCSPSWNKQDIYWKVLVWMICCLGMYSPASEQHICELLHRDSDCIVIHPNNKLNSCHYPNPPVLPLSHFYWKDSSNRAFGIQQFMSINILTFLKEHPSAHFGNANPWSQRPMRLKTE